ncbi:hypothetical protein LINPERHAP2_LOCUS37282 [Linum perenne]
MVVEWLKEENMLNTKGGLQKVMTVGLASVTHFELSCTTTVDLQYERIEKMWYSNNGLHRVSSDSDLKNCLDTAVGCPKKIFIYLKGVSRPGAIHDEGVAGDNNDNRLSGSGSHSDSVSVEHSSVRGVSHLVDNDDRTSDEEFNVAMGFLGVRQRRRRVGTRDDMSGEEVEQLSVFESDVVISSSSKEGDHPNDEARTNAREDSDHVRGNLSDEDGQGNYWRGPIYDPGCDHGALQFELGLRFRDPTQFKEAVIRNSIIIGANVRWMRSSKTRREVVCKHPSCKWRLYAAWYRGRELFVVKQIDAAHSCPRILLVMEGSNGFVVDLNMMSCSCGYWGLSGIPCHHGVSAITYFRLDVEPFVHKYYYTDYVARGYTNGIPPLLGQQAWPNVSGSAIHPPRLKQTARNPIITRGAVLSWQLNNQPSMFNGPQKLCKKNPLYTFEKNPLWFEPEEEVQDSAGLANNLDIILGAAPLNRASKLLKSMILEDPLFKGS